jgi:hypothetical protein
MITTPEDFKKRLDEIEAGSLSGQDAIKMINPDTEAKFTIDANTRTIKIPNQFQDNAAICRDHESETLYFEIDRYFDNVDLYDKSCIVQYINANGGQYVFPVTDKYMSDDTNKIIFAWDLNSNATAYPGTVKFSIRFYSLENNVYTYNWGTKPSAITIGEGLYITDSGETLPAGDDLTQLIDKINGIYMNGNLGGVTDYNDLDNLPYINGVRVKGSLTLQDLGIDTTLDENIIRRKDIDDALNENSINPVQNVAVTKAIRDNTDLIGELEKSTDAKIKKLSDDVDELYPDIKVLRFQNKPVLVNGGTKGYEFSETNYVQCGFPVNQVYFDIVLSRDADTITVDDGGSKSDTKELGKWDDSDGGNGLVGPWNYRDPQTVTFTLTASDTHKKTGIATTELVFCKGIYFGSVAAPTALTSDFVQEKLSKQLMTSADGFSFTVDNKEDEYIYIAIPTEQGLFDISVGGFVGGFDETAGFSKEDNNEFFVNIQANTSTTLYQFPYYVYRSSYPNLGQTTVTLHKRKEVS